MSNLATNIVIGAALAGSFNSNIGHAVAGIGQINNAVSQLGGALAQVGGAWASLRGIGSAVSMASDLEHELMKAGVTADMTNEQIAALKEQLRGLSVPERTNQSMQELLKGFGALVSAGMDKDRASAMLEALGRTATASQASMEDLAKTAFILNDTLGVAPEAMGKALDQLAFAGKQGAFELKDMARYFPVLGAAAKEAGIQGEEAVATLGAALQMAKKGAADPSEAANNMKNFLAKMMAPETINKFKEHGVNVTKIFSDAMKKGENPIEVMLKKIDGMLGSDVTNRKARLGALFGDMQVQDFIRPMLANMGDYKKLKSDIMKSSGTVDTDFARMMETNKELTTGFTVQLGKLGEAIGSALVPPMNLALKAITPIVTVLGEMATNSPATTAALVTFGSAVTLLPPAIGAVTVAWSILSKSMIASPIGLAIGAVAVGAGLIIDNWGAVKSFFSTIWNGVAEHWRTILAFTGPIGWMAIKIVDNFELIRSTALSLWNGVAEKWGELMTAVAPIGEAISGVFEGVWTKVTAAWDAGVSNIMAIWERVRGPLTDFAKMMGWIAPDGGKIPAIGSAVRPPAANDNAVNDNIPQVGSVVAVANGGTVMAPPGAGLAVSEARGAAIMGGSASSGSASVGPTSGGSSVGSQHVVVELVLPPGMRAEMRGTAPGVAVIARTGQSRVGEN